MNFLGFLVFCKLVLSLEVGDSSLFQNDLQTPDFLIGNSLDNTASDIFSTSSAGSDDSSILALSGNTIPALSSNDNTPLISDDVAGSLDLFDLSEAGEEEGPDLLSNNIIQSPDLFTPIASNDPAVVLDPLSVSGTTGLEAGDTQNLAFLDDIPAVPLTNPLDFIRGIYDNLKDSPLLEDPPPDKSKVPWIPVCEPDYHPFCCLKGPPSPRWYPESSDRRAQCYTYDFNLQVCDDLAHHACCICKDTRRKAYECWNPHTSSPETFGPGYKARRSPAFAGKREVGTSDSNTPIPDDDTAVEEANQKVPYQYLDKLLPDSCTDAYLRSIGVAPQRHNYPKVKQERHAT